MSTVIYFGMRHLLFRMLDREHEVIIAAVESSYDPITKTFRILDSRRLFVNEDMDQAYVTIFDESKNELYRSPIVDQIRMVIPLAIEELKRTTMLEHPADQMPVIHTISQPHVRFHATSTKLHYGERHVGWINIASPLGDVEDALLRLLWVLSGGVVLSGLLVGGGGYFLTGRALTPVAAIARTARRISSTRLSERVDVGNKHDEIGQLAAVLNDLLHRLEQAFESQKRFAADAVHELKTPVSVLRTHWEDELSNPDLPDDFKEKLVGDIETIARLSRVINNLLLLSHAEVIRADTVFAPVPLAALIDDVIDDTAVLAEMKSQTLRRGPVEPVTVNGDRDRLYQLVFNLVDNAVKYTPEDGEITLTLEADASEAVLRVADTGRGIPPNDLPHIFDRFYRVGSDRSSRTGGSGLGLAICKMIAELHGGSISATSTVDEGSVFSIRFPTSP
ncbi:MAG: HAMP domain-containing protein [Candidatus Latescibacterota bacterium]|nr:MAG: HAMP domain-containing protein [Candidatus Latescibacterota bacterium]